MCMTNGARPGDRAGAGGRDGTGGVRASRTPGSGGALALVGCPGVLVDSQQATAGGGALYAPGTPLTFTYPPFAALLFAVFAGAPLGVLKGVLTVGSLVALVALCGLSLGAAGVRQRPESVFAMSAIALLTWPFLRARCTSVRST